MELEFAMLALGAEASQSGKLHIFGGAFDTVTVPELPWTIPPFAIVVQVSGGNIHAEELLSLRLIGINPVGEQRVLVEELSVKLQPPAPPERVIAYASAILNVGLKVGNYGCYKFRIEVNDRELKTLNLWIQGEGENSQ